MPKEINELILYVKDMAGMVSFYRDCVGLAVTFPADLEDYSGDHWVTFSTGTCTLALHGGGSGERAGEQPRFGFFVSNLQESRERLLGHGVDCGEARSVAAGIFVCDCRDPEGNGFFIETHQY